MKFTINKDQLSTAVEQLMRVVPKKPILPSLAYLFVKLEENHLTISASDSDRTMSTVLEVESPTGDGEILVLADVLANLLKTISDDYLLFDHNEEKSTLKVKWQNGSSALPTTPTQDFTRVKAPDEDAEFTFTTTSEALWTAIHKTHFAISKDPSKPVINGIFFDLDKDAARLVATNANLMVVYDMQMKGGNGKSGFILPAETISVLRNVLPKEKEITVTTDCRCARFSYGDTCIDTILTKGKFPNYRSVIPNYNGNPMSVPKETLVNTLKRAKVFAEKTKLLVMLLVRKDEITVEARDPLFGMHFHETVKCSYDGKEMDLILKAEGLESIISHLETENAEMLFEDNRHAVMIRPAEEKDIEDPYFGVIMPWVTK